MEKRESFSSRLGFILVSAGCAIGLGNVWKFPYICGKYGGAVFILIYLLFLLILGLPILISEFAIGRGSKRSIASAFNELEPKNTVWHRFKWFGICGNYLLMMFYTMVGGWMFCYIFKMIKGSLYNLSSKDVSNEFSAMLNSPGTMIFWTIITIVIAFCICALGLKNGVEKITKVMMILLICLMVVLAVHSLFLKGAEEGLRFYLIPDFNKLTENGVGEVIFAAMTHAFFTLSIGIGAMEIFGSYLEKSKRLTGEAISVILLDTFVALTAGLIIIPACFAYNIKPDAGPSLLFITLPNVFNNMAGGRIWGIYFFVFMSFAALSTIIAVFENITAMTMEIFNVKRKKAVIVNMILIMLLSLPAVLGYNLLKDIQPIGAGSTIMDLEDFLVSYNILPLGSLVFVLFCTKKNGWGYKNFLEEVDLGQGIAFPKKLRFYIKYILPLIIIIVYLKGYYDMFSVFGTKVLTIWMVIALAFLGLILSFSFNRGKRKEKQGS